MKMQSLITIIAVLAASLASSHVEAKPERDGKGKGKGEKDVSAIFKAIDADGDGRITAEELGKSKKFAKASPKEVADAFAAKDLNGDGAISGQEFVRTFGNAREGREGANAGKKKGGKGKGDKGGERRGKGKAGGGGAS